MAENNLSPELQDVSTYRYRNNGLHFERTVNAETTDAEVNHAIDDTQLDIVLDNSWTERFFYGIGN